MKIDVVLWANDVQKTLATIDFKEAAESALPPSSAPLPLSPSFSLSQAADVVFMALCMWREAGGESDDCKAGVGYCIMNRFRHPGWWGDSILAVIFKKWQFSSMTDPHCPILTKWPLPSDRSWRACLDIAEGVIKGSIPNPVLGADSFFDISIPDPNWATADTFVKQIGRMKFYNVDHDHEEAAVRQPQP